MKLPELKQRVYQAWERRCWYNQSVIQPELFPSEIRQYGDLRYKTTWIKALTNNFPLVNLTTNSATEAVQQSYDRVAIFALIFLLPSSLATLVKHKVFVPLFVYPNRLQVIHQDVVDEK